MVVNVLSKPEHHVFQSFAVMTKIPNIEIKTESSPVGDLTHLTMLDPAFVLNLGISYLIDYFAFILMFF